MKTELIDIVAIMLVPLLLAILVHGLANPVKQIQLSGVVISKEIVPKLGVSYGLGFDGNMALCTTEQYAFTIHVRQNMPDGSTRDVVKNVDLKMFNSIVVGQQISWSK